MEFYKKRELLSKYIDGESTSNEEAQIMRFLINEDPATLVLLENFWHGECPDESGSDRTSMQEQLILQRISDLEHYTSQGYCLGILQ